MRNKYLLLLLSFFLFGAAPTRPYTYTAGEAIDPDQVMAVEDALYNYLTAGVDTYKDETILNADISNSANIQSDKLNLSSIVGAVAFGTLGTLSLPNSTSTPSTCTAGMVYFDTDATSGSNLYGCVSTDTWALQSGGGTSSTGDVTSIGDCTEGTCFNGGSGYGTYLRIYDNNSNYSQIQSADISSNIILTFPSSTSTLLSTTSTWAGGDLSGTGIAASVIDDSHSHTTTTIGGIDVSSDTNLAVSGTLLQLSGDTLSLKEGTLTSGKYCIYTAGTGIVCNSEGGTGVTGAPTDATYITQTANSTLTAEQALSTLSTGIMKVTTTTGAITSLTNSAGILGVVSDETGTGVLTFATAPTFTSQIITPKILSASSGTLTLGGSGGTNNENLTLNFDSTSNQVALESGTGATKVTTTLAITTTGTVTTAGIDYSGSDQYLNVARATDKTAPTEGDIWYNTVDNHYTYYDGSANRNIPYKQSKSIFIESPVLSDTYLTVMVAFDAFTVRNVKCIVDPQQNSITRQVEMAIMECGSTGDSCGYINNPVTCNNTTTASATIINSGVDADDWVIARVLSVTGVVTGVNLSFDYTID